MGITYEVDASKGVVFERWLGAIAGTDIVDHWLLLATDKEAMACGRSVADIRECALHVSGEELRSLVRFVLEPVLRGRPWRTAVLVREPVQFGMAREYQTLAEVFKEDAVFTDLSAACLWVESERGPASDSSTRVIGGDGEAVVAVRPLRSRETVTGELAKDRERFKRKWQLILDNARKLDGESRFPLAEAYSEDFMRQHTLVSSFEQLMEAGGYGGMGFAAIPAEAWEATVRAHTSFASWLEMQQAAAAMWVRDRL